MSTTTRYTIKKATVSDKIRFHESDIVDASVQTLAVNSFTYDLGDRFFTTLEYDETTGMCSVPSGAWRKLNIVELVDNRTAFEKHDWSFTGTLRPNQLEVVTRFVTEEKTYSGLMQAGCGFGKTFSGAWIVGESKKPTLIICHTKLLAAQWLAELNRLIDPADIGFIGDGKEVIKPITVGIYKSLINRIDKLNGLFEIMIVDETHLAPAETFSKVVNGISARTKIGLTATPWRKDGLHVVLSDYFGPNKVIARDTGKLIPKVQIVQTSVVFHIINPNRDWTKQLTKLCANTAYMDSIATRAIDMVARGRCVLILAERLAMLEYLNSKIPNSILLVGNTKNRDEILDNVGSKYSVVLSTKIFDEGISCHRLDTLFLTNPNNNPAKLEQRIGRILREHPDKKNPMVVDFWLQGNIVQAQQRNRKLWYIKNNYPILN